jgi:hypothetical protein
MVPKIEKMIGHSVTKQATPHVAKPKKKAAKKKAAKAPAKRKAA